MIVVFTAVMAQLPVHLFKMIKKLQLFVIVLRLQLLKFSSTYGFSLKYRKNELLGTTIELLLLNYTRVHQPNLDLNAAI